MELELLRLNIRVRRVEVKININFYSFIYFDKLYVFCIYASNTVLNKICICVLESMYILNYNARIC